MSIGCNGDCTGVQAIPTCQIQTRVNAGLKNQGKITYLSVSDVEFKHKKLYSSANVSTKIRLLIFEIDKINLPLVGRSKEMQTVDMLFSVSDITCESSPNRSVAVGLVQQNLSSCTQSTSRTATFNCGVRKIPIRHVNYSFDIQ